MGNIIAVFGNRNHALQYASYLKRNGIRNKVVDTPRELSVSCGISIIFSQENMGRAKLILARTNMIPYVRLYLISGDLFKKYMPIAV